MLTPADLYIYRAELLRVVDGDTVYLDVDLGGRVRISWDCRMRGYDAPSRTSLPGKQAAINLSHLLTGNPLLIRTVQDKYDKYGRYLVEITLPDGRDVCAEMLAAGNCFPWDGTGGHPDQPGHE